MNAERDTMVWPATPVDAGPAPELTGELAALSHQGRVRTNNEDHFLVVRFGRVLQTLMTNLPEGSVPDAVEDVGYGMVVADGMGGMAAGELASELAIRTLMHLVLATPDWIMDPQHLSERVMARFARRFQRIGEKLSDAARQDPSLAGMGTTMTLSCSVGAQLFIAHIGDSRAYLWRDGALHQLTRDHTMAQALVERGLLRPEEAMRNRLKHVLTRALGGSDRNFEPDVQGLTLHPGDQILLCSDGLSDMVQPTDIEAILRSAPSARQACEALIEHALESGGRDNVTVALARYGERGT